MSRIRGGFLVVAAMLATGTAARAADCPVVTLDPKTQNTVAYPGGEPGRHKQDYSYIGVLLTAYAVCTTDDNDQVIAQINVTYALEAGPLYRGAAEVTVAAKVNGGAGAEGSATKRSTPATGGAALTVNDTIANVVVGEEDAVEDGTYSIIVGFAEVK